MTQLQIINQNGQLLVDSREVAEMIGKTHAHLLRDIDGYIQILGKSNFGLSDFFIESGYESGNRQYKCFLLTRKGCDMVANKLTGEKGVLFTATYVTRFEEMEKELSNPKPKTQLEVLQCTINQLVEQERRLSDAELRLVEVEKKQESITEIISLNPTEWRKKVNAIINKIADSMGGFQAYQDIRNESYRKLEERAGCNLSIRLTNKKRKMSLEGVAKSKVDKVNKMDVIADDARLTEIYLAIVKEMAIQYQVKLENIS